MTLDQAELIHRRETVMDGADAALDAAWPERKGDDYTRAMQEAAVELERVAEQMAHAGAPMIEQSKTHRYLGSVYSDLAPSLGRQMLHQASKAYSKAEKLLDGSDDVLERAKLDFNFANTLRQIDPNDLGRLEEAQRRFAAAAKVFSETAPEDLERAQEAQRLCRRLIQLARLRQRVERSQAEITSLQDQLAADADLVELAAKMKELEARSQAILSEAFQVMPDPDEPLDLAEDSYRELEQKLSTLAKHQTGGAVEIAGKQVIDTLRAKVREEAERGTLQDERARTLLGLLSRVEKEMGPHQGDLESLIERMTALQQAAEALARTSGGDPGEEGE